MTAAHTLPPGHDYRCEGPSGHPCACSLRAENARLMAQVAELREAGRELYNAVGRLRHDAWNIQGMFHAHFW